MRHIWFDTEFIENGRTIELVSIGAIDARGETFYAEVNSAGVDLDTGDEWFQANVRPHLIGGDALASRAQIAVDFQAFAGDSPVFHAYYADYDWVVLCQLYGRMVDLPAGWPMFCRDVQQTCVELGVRTLPPQTGNAHCALDDAAWCQEAWHYLQARRRWIPLDKDEVSSWLKSYIPAYDLLPRATIAETLEGVPEGSSYREYIRDLYTSSLQRDWASGKIPREPPDPRGG